MPEHQFEESSKNLRTPEPAKPAGDQKDPAAKPFMALQQQVGNRAVQRLIQRSSSGESEVDEETANRINANRGGGEALDEGAQESIGAAMGQDFSDVRVHTSTESDSLNKQLGAEAFTTGKDVFFSDGAYDPNTSSGQELLAHELTHVVQQGSGVAGGSSGGMSVNAPGDSHEQEADSVAEAVVNAPVQRQEEEEELAMPKLAAQRQEEEEEMAMTKPAVQRQEEDPEEEVLSQVDNEEEEEMQP